jgi:hypothetical protein
MNIVENVDLVVVSGAVDDGPEIGHADIMAGLASVGSWQEDGRRSFRNSVNKLKEKGTDGMRDFVSNSSGAFVKSGMTAKATLIESILLVMSSGGLAYWQDKLVTGKLEKQLDELSKAECKILQLPSRDKISNMLANLAPDDPMKVYYQSDAFERKFGAIIDNSAEFIKYNRNVRDRNKTKYNTVLKTFEKMIGSPAAWSCINDLNVIKRPREAEVEDGVSDKRTKV